MGRIARRGNVYYYIRRVPARFAGVDSRVIVRQSLHTDSERAARAAAVLVNAELESLWTSLAAQGDPDAWRRYHAAIERARLEGFTYRPAAEIAARPLEEVQGRLRALGGRTHDPSAVSALAGGVSAPDTLLSAVPELFYGFAAGDLLGKRDDQIRRWKSARQLAVDNFITAIGEDKPVATLTRDDARRFRQWWIDRIKTENLGRNSLNKQIGYISRMLSVLNDEMRLGIEPIFTKLRVDELKVQRPSFDQAFVEKVFLGGALAGMNEDARIAFFVCAETGMGAEEVTSLREKHIRLSGKIPHVVIERREGAEQKTSYRQREIPLVGVALIAMRKRPKGIERYFEKNASLSTAVNKFLRKNKLLPTEQHSFYSLRHSFQSRLTAAEAPDRLQADLMGHKYVREKYGTVALAQKQKWLRRIAYRVPDDFAV